MMRLARELQRLRIDFRQRTGSSARGTAADGIRAGTRGAGYAFTGREHAAWHFRNPRDHRRFDRHALQCVHQPGIAQSIDVISSGLGARLIR
ncbi:hypothetical protein C6V05_22605 [Burkholderia multivorans]|nr:hypothetical protein C6V05_22605 [Burkholderia multivorans]